MSGVLNGLRFATPDNAVALSVDRLLDEPGYLQFSLSAACGICTMGIDLDVEEARQLRDLLTAFIQAP
jgi:hypothetical protein